MAISEEKKRESFERLKKFAEDNGFELLEAEWLGNNTKHRFLHKEGGKEYQWPPAQLFSDRDGFPKDLRTQQDRYIELKQLAEESGFELLETEWLGNAVKCRFLQKETGREYEWVPRQILGQGFPKDLRTKQDRLNSLKQFAEESGFELLEAEWLGNAVKHRFHHKETGREYEWVPPDVLRKGFPKDLRTDEDRFSDLKLLAKDNGFELLETEWLGSQKKHRFLHKEGGKEYEWKPDQVLSRGFPISRGLLTDLDRFNELKKIAEENGFTLLETGWLGSNKNHRFLHMESGREYEGAPNKILVRGFPKDLRTTQDRYNELKQLAEDNGFELLDTEWLGSESKHRFLHKQSGLERMWIPAQVLRAGFPKDLRTDQDRFNELRQFAKENGFELLETEWLGDRGKHRFLHKQSGKEYEGAPNKILFRGFPEDLRTDQDRLNELKKLADDNGFELLETSWLGSREKHRFLHKESGKEYEWAPAISLRSGFPMVDGQRYLTQEVCRQVFVHIFGGQFKTDRERLKARNGGQSMELDGYEEFQSVPDPLTKVSSYMDKEGAEVAFNLPVAFEFQGHESHQTDEKTIERDKLKAEFCKKEGVLLVQIEPPVDKKQYGDFWNRIRDSDFMYTYVCKSIQQTVGVDEEINFPHGFKIDLSNWNPDKEAYLNLKQFAEDNGFELLETEWFGAFRKHRFLHKESGKEREWMPTQVLRVGFPEDLRTNIDKYNNLNKHAEDNGFKLLEAEWLGGKTKHRFLHKESGKEYEWPPLDVLCRGFPKDLRTPRDRFNELRQLADENGFELLGTEWLGSKSQHRFIHKKTGKEYEWPPYFIFRKGFPIDLRTEVDRFNELKQFAEGNGFELLELEWLGSREKHRFLRKDSGKEYEWPPSQVLSRGFPISRGLLTDLDKFNELKKLAEENGFELLEAEWLGSHVKHRFLHKDSVQEYKGRPNSVFRNGFPKRFSAPKESSQADTSPQDKLAAEKARKDELAAQMPPYPGDDPMPEPPQPTPPGSPPVADVDKDPSNAPANDELDDPDAEDPDIDRPRWRA